MSGYPDRSGAWTKNGCNMAVKILLEENNPLFDSLMNKLGQFPDRIGDKMLIEAVV